MDHYVPQHLPLALRAFQLTRAPLKMLKVVWDKKKYKISIISGASLSIYILWKIGNERAKRNRDERTFVVFFLIYHSLFSFLFI